MQRVSFMCVSTPVPPRRWAFLIGIFLGIALTQTVIPQEKGKLGGETTLMLTRSARMDRGVFSRPAANLSLTRRGDFFAGNSFFQGVWVKAPASTKARDGLGPLFNTMSCQSCHVRDGRGRPPEKGDEMLSMLLRISVPTPANPSPEERKLLRTQGVIGDPVYGTQIQNRALANLKPEATVKIKWEETPGEFPDGEKYRLRRPVYQIEQPGYGAFHEQLQVSPRVAPSLIGIGLLDTISTENLRRNLDPEDQNGDGISGRFNQVWDVRKQKIVPGRFGWKAEQPNVRQQVASAFHGDIGITSSLFPGKTLTEKQAEMIQSPHGGDPEVSDEILELVTFYSKTLAVPSQRSYQSKVIQEGKKLFFDANCQACHHAEWVTGEDASFPELSKQKIYPYTDLLLHDMGAGLADRRPSFDATGREWRTPPLWGIGLVFRVNRHTLYLHDGRARNLQEAILWHGGEAESSKQKFVQLSREQRRKLLSFLKSL